MARLDVLATAKGLVKEYGPEARSYADSQALDAFVCGEVELSEEWERVSAAIESLLQNYPALRSAAAA